MKRTGILLSAGLLALCGALAGQARAAGFALVEHSASGMGTAFAGAGAAAHDPSTVWFNPAGMTRLQGAQMSAALHAIIPSADFTDKGSYINPALTGNNVTPGSLSGANADGGVTAAVPNFYYVRPFSPDLYFGLAINVPFGLETDYPADWVGRYHALNSKVATVNINPSLAYRVSPKLSIGGGISAQYIKVDLSSAIDSGALCLKLAQTTAQQAACATAGLLPNTVANDSQVEISGDDWSFGVNLGLLYDVTPSLRLGLAWRSAIDQDLSGSADFTVNAALQTVLTTAGVPLLQDTGVRATASLPQSATLSAAWQVTPEVELLADATWTGWSSFDELRIKFDNPAQPDAVTDESWEDVWRFGLGVNYHYSSRLTLRGGLAYDNEPIPDAEHRTPRIPGNDRTWVAAGAGLRLGPRLSLDFGYAHLFVDDTPINHTDDNGYALRGVYENSVDILSAQLNWQF